MTRTRLAVLILALVAGTVLLAWPRGGEEPPAAVRAPLATLWPHARRADLPGHLADGPVFTPQLFRDERTAIGTAPTPGGDRLRLLVRGPGGPRELRRVPLRGDPVFAGFATDGTTVAWTESATGRPAQVWAATWDGPARRLTAGAGDVLDFGSEHDLAIAGGAVHWAAAAPRPARCGPATEIRSVPLTGGPVTVRTEPGAWSLTAWPWLVNGSGDGTGTTRLRNTGSGSPSVHPGPECTDGLPLRDRATDVEVATAGAELATCRPSWCRVVVVAGGAVTRIDAMRPDGSGRRRIAGGEASAAVADVALLDRFEVLAEERPDSALTGTQALVVHDLASGRTAELTGTADAANARAGVLWWSTGAPDDLVWHTLDLRTVQDAPAVRSARFPGRS